MSASPGNGLAAKWLPEHDDELRELRATGFSFAGVAAGINGKFRTSYSRNACIGRAGRLGLAMPAKKSHMKRDAIEHRLATRKIKPRAAPQVFACDETGLRIADVVPLNISIDDLTDDTCRWPYGERPVVYCGLQSLEGLPYCASHTALAAKPMQGVNFNQSEAQAAAHRKIIRPAVITLALSMDSESAA